MNKLSEKISKEVANMEQQIFDLEHQVFRFSQEIQRLEGCCERHNAKPENAEHKIGYKKTAKKPARKLTPQEYFVKFYRSIPNEGFVVNYRQNLIYGNTIDRCYAEFENEWYKNN